VDEALPAQLLGDPTRTQQILTNLLDNAVKFTSTGRISVGVGSCTAEDGRRMLRVAVTDSGIGIAEDKRALVFDKYRQADSSTTRRYGGTGLGLAICRQLAAWMDGDVGLESEVGKGSTFWFTIPLAPVELAQATVLSTGDATPLETTPYVLVVEDSQTNQFVAQRFLQKLGCRVELANNGAEALERVRAEAFDVVFMDCQMPVMDGYEATRRIRQLERGRNLPIVAMTAHAMTGDREKCLAAGMDDYVSKPLKSDLLLAVLRRATRERPRTPRSISTTCGASSVTMKPSASSSPSCGPTWRSTPTGCPPPCRRAITPRCGKPRMRSRERCRTCRRGRAGTWPTASTAA
jgi:CheY-like chemotaxis protein